MVGKWQLYTVYRFCSRIWDINESDAQLQFFQAIVLAISIWHFLFTVLLAEYKTVEQKVKTDTI